MAGQTLLSRLAIKAGGCLLSLFQDEEDTSATREVGPSAPNGRYAYDRELEILGDTDVALGILDMVFSTPEWIHRRSETITFLTDTHRKRRVSLDLTVPNPCPSRTAWLDGRPTCLLPIDVLAKEPLRGFDSQLEDGRPFPVLTRRQNGEIAWRGMVAYANQVLSTNDAGPLGHHGSEVLRRVTQEPTARAERYVRLIELLARRRADARILIADEGFAVALHMFAKNFLLIAAISAEEGERRILKFSYEEPHSRRDNRTRREVFTESLAWRPATIEVPVLGFSDCESYHFEAVAPDGVEFIDVVLGDESRVVDGKVDPKWTIGHSRLIDSSPHRAHLAVSRTSNTSSAPDEFVMPTVSLKLQIARNGWLRATSRMSLFVAALMLASLPFVVNLGTTRRCDVPGPFASLEFWLCGPIATADINTDPAALLVALVGFVSVVVLRSGEHAYTANRVRLLRHAAFISAFAPMAGAWLLTFQGPGTVLSVGWCVLTVAAWLATSLLRVARCRLAR